jgi:hypothetical protein
LEVPTLAGKRQYTYTLRAFGQIAIGRVVAKDGQDARLKAYERHGVEFEIVEASGQLRADTKAAS